MFRVLLSSQVGDTRLYRERERERERERDNVHLEVQDKYNPIGSYFVWGYYGTQYRVRLYPPFGCSILYYYLTRFNYQKNTTQL